MLFIPTTSLAAAKEKKELPPWHEIEQDFEAPAEKVFNILSNCKNYSELFLFLDKSRLLYERREGPNKRVKINVCYFESKFLADALWSKIQFTAVKTDMNTYIILAKALEKNFDVVNLEWKITSLAPNQTRLYGKFRIEPNLPLPDRTVQIYAKRSFKRVFYLFILRKIQL